MACNGNCQGCQSECEKKPLRLPNTTGAILGQFMMDMYQRSVVQKAGELSEEKMDEIDRKMLNWLGATFTGQNDQFEIDKEWYPNGLAGNLRFKLGNELAQASGGKLPEDNKTLIFSAFAVFMAEVYNTFYELSAKGVAPFGEQAAPEIMLLWKRWTELLVGVELHFRDSSAEGEKAEDQAE